MGNSFCNHPFQGNKFLCNCKFRWLLNARDAGLTTEIDSTPCTEGPSNLASIQWSNLKVLIVVVVVVDVLDVVDIVDIVDVVDYVVVVVVVVV